MGEKRKKNKKQETVKEIRKITKADRKISRAERVSIAKIFNHIILQRSQI